MRLLTLLLLATLGSAASAQDWRPVEVAPCGVVVEVPGAVRSGADRTARRSGVPVVVHGMEAYAAPEQFTVTCVDYPSGHLASVGVESFLDDHLGRGTDDVERVRYEPVVWNGRPGRRVTWRLPLGERELRSHALVIVDGDRVIELGLGAFVSPDEVAARFFDSLGPAPGR